MKLSENQWINFELGKQQRKRERETLRRLRCVRLFRVKMTWGKIKKGFPYVDVKINPKCEKREKDFLPRNSAKKKDKIHGDQESGVGPIEWENSAALWDNSIQYGAFKMKEKYKFTQRLLFPPILSLSHQSTSWREGRLHKTSGKTSKRLYERVSTWEKHQKCKSEKRRGEKEKRKRNEGERAKRDEP